MAVSGNFTAVHIEDCFTSTYIYTTAGRTGDFTGLFFRAVTKRESCIACDCNTAVRRAVLCLQKSDGMAIQTQYDTVVTHPILINNNISR